MTSKVDDCVSRFVDAAIRSMEVAGEEISIQQRETKPARAAESLRRLPATTPPSFAHLVCCYTWDTLETEDIRFLENPDANDVDPFIDAMLNRDPALYRPLLKAGYLPIGFALHSTFYDPICLDTARAALNECPVVRFDHERIEADSPGNAILVAKTFVAFLEDETQKMLR